MSFLIPGTRHAITWSKQNLLDETTYYVRAVIRDVRTETILDTIDLEDLGGGRFYATWNVVQDPTGQGREIEVQKTVYEDSGYTQVSGIYGRWLDRYTVYDFHAAGRAGAGGWGGGESIDYATVRKIMAEELRELLGLLPKPSAPVEDTTLGARMRELIRIGKKADAIEDLEEKIASALTTFITTVEKAERDIKATAETASRDFSRETTETLALLKEQVSSIVDALDTRLEQKTDDELTHFSAKLKEVLDNSIDTLTDQMQERLVGASAGRFKELFRSAVDAIPDEIPERPEREPSSRPRSSPSQNPDARVENLLAFDTPSA